MRNKESVLTAIQLQHLEIEHFIFHIIIPDRKENPVIALDEVILTASQRHFFTERLREAGYGTQFLFRQDLTHLREKCATLLENNGLLALISRQLAEDFASRHKGNMSPGVFVVSIAKTFRTENQPIRLIFLAKLDHKLVYRYFTEERNGGITARMEEVTNTLVEDKSAMQKSAIISIGDEFAWDLLAWERQGKPDGDLRDYFRGFLGAQMREDASVLTCRAVSVVRKWGFTIRATELPPGEDGQSFHLRAVQYMKDRDTFKTDEFLQTVVRDEDEERKARLCASLNEALIESGISGQTFRPKPNSLPKKVQRSIYETIEGVRIELSRPKEDCGVSIDRQKSGAVITIRTTNLSVKLDS